MACVPYATAHSAARPSIAACAAPNGSSGAASRVRRQNRHIGPAWQGASPLRRRLAVATATTLRRPPHPLRCTGAAQHHLSPMRASSAKRHNAGGERARARRKAAWCRCRKASLLAGMGTEESLYSGGDSGGGERISDTSCCRVVRGRRAERTLSSA